MRSNRWVAALAALQVALHLLTNGRYGMFRDEFYYLVCADHLAWGYVDQPPLSIVLLAAWTKLVGESVCAVRVIPALVGAGLIFGTAALARELGGGRRAETLAAACAAFAPSVLAITGYYSMNSFDNAFWLAIGWTVVRLERTRDPRLWLLLGALVGLGTLNKLSVAFLTLGLIVALPLSPLRAHLSQLRLWLGIALAALLMLPFVLWQVGHEWPTLEFMSNARLYKNVRMNPLELFGNTALEVGPPGALVGAIGLGALLLARRLRPFRSLGIAHLFVLVLLASQGAKPYYLLPAAFALFAAGAVAFDGWGPLAGRVVLAAVALFGVLSLPIALPLLPPERMVAYQAWLGIAPAASEEGHHGTSMPQHLADRFGWTEMMHVVKEAWRALPENERASCAIVTDNYGQAGALRVLGERHGLPPACSLHNNFYLWGLEPADPSVVIAVGFDAERLADVFEHLEPAGVVESPFAMPYETGYTVYVCRGWRSPPAEVWNAGRSYI